MVARSQAGVYLPSQAHLLSSSTSILAFTMASRASRSSSGERALPSGIWREGEGG